MASDGQNMQEAKILAMEDINAAGGVLGRPIELIFFDSKELLAETFAAAAEKLINQEQVDAVIASYSGESGPATFRQYDQPFIYGEPSRACIRLYTDARDTAGNIHLGAANGVIYGEKMWQAIMDLTEANGYEFPNNRLQVLTGPWEWSFDHGEGIMPVAEAAGWEVAEPIVVALETREWAGVQAGIREFDPAIIFMEAYDTGCVASFTQQLNTDPINALIAHSQIALAPAYIDLMGTEANGVMGLAISDVQHGDPAGDDYVTRYEARWGRPAPKSESAKAYDFMNIWKSAVERVGSVSDYAAINQAINEYPYTGLGGTYEFNEDHYCPDFPPHVYQVQGGEWIELWYGGEIVPEAGTWQVPPWID
jgi:ABC-type branched-subunit amino acid transport system substrate-binding protein